MVLYSHSRLGTYETCPLKYRFNYIDKIEEEGTGIEAFLGSRVHETFEKLYIDLKFQKLNSLQDLLDHYNKIWEEKWTDDIAIVREEYDAENYRKMGEKFITDYYNRYKPFDQETLISVEERVVINIDGYQIQGYIDRLGCKDGVYYIHDYKTANTLMTQEYADKDRQLALYSIAVKEKYKDCKKVVLIWHYLAFDKEIVSERTDEQLEELKQEIVSLIKIIESAQEFSHNVSALCSWCGYKKLCPEFKHKYEIEILEENEYMNEDGVVLAEKFRELNERKKAAEEEYEKVKDALIKYAENKGITAVQGKEGRVVIREYPKMSFPKKEDPEQEAFFETVKALGLWEKLAVVDVYSLSKMINNGDLHEDFVKVLNQFITRGKIHYVRYCN